LTGRLVNHLSLPIGDRLLGGGLPRSSDRKRARGGLPQGALGEVG
jgi:hypothetical protein